MEEKELKIPGYAAVLICVMIFALGYRKGRAVNEKLIKTIISKNPTLQF